ncbi:FtsX-like permease family protein [Chitinophaga lutea]|uniref:FtsX-like permease family protein n=1 Tax=Chitinophaga lutea TaxID=2488634 RepID=A0A3N4PJB2_9BACT|nr:ABC transporter permease [Chitinophaga lutea]RPE07895.1 FtsX-like permease family protein [Chitinophaga lutea]
MLSTLKILWSSFKMALQELRVNKLRTFLSLLGITIGIFCIIAVLTVTDSMESTIRNDLKSLGTNVVYLQKWPWDGDGEWWRYMNRPEPEYSEMRSIKEKVATADAVTYLFSSGGRKIEFGADYMENVELLAVTMDLDKMQAVDIAAGRYFSPSELMNGSNVIVLGANIWEGLFFTADAAVGKVVRFSNRNCKVVGALKKKGESMMGGVFGDNTVIMPYLFARTIIDERRFADPFYMIRARPDVAVGELKDDLTGAMRAIHRLKPTQDNDFALNEITTVQGELESVFSVLNIAGWLIAGFALVVGGFGIANIMFVTVKERTNIIGLKKAIGARPGIILLEFLLEAILLCLIGGGLGLLLVFSGTLIAGNMFDSFQIALSTGNIVLGLSISAIVGILAGFIPAFTASRLDPVVAIRSN